MTSSPASDAAASLLAELVGSGICDVVISPGSRSQAIALAAARLDRDGSLRMHVRIDERVVWTRQLERRGAHPESCGDRSVRAEHDDRRCRIARDVAQQSLGRRVQREQTLGDAVMTMRAGDSLHYSGATPHGWANRGTDGARMLWTGTLNVLHRRGGLRPLPLAGTPDPATDAPSPRPDWSKTP